MKNILRFLFGVHCLIASPSASPAQWIQTNFPSTAKVSAFAVSHDGAGGTDLFAATICDGVFLSADSGMTWNRAGLDGACIDALAVSPGGVDGTNLYASYSPYGVLHFTDNGTNWTYINNGLPFNSHGGCNMSSLTILGAYLYAGGYYDGIYFSTNNGTNWSSAGLGGNDVRAIIGYPNGSGGTYLFAGTDGPDGVFRSTDNGQSWLAVSAGLKYTGDVNYSIYDFTTCSDGADGTRLFVATYRGVYLSTNNGTSWTRASAGLLPTDWPYIEALAVSPNGASGTKLFAGTLSRGVFLSTDNGTSWSAVNAGLMYTETSALAVCGTYLFAATGGGDWR